MEYLFGKQSFKMGFNRYMVECELLSALTSIKNGGTF